MPGMTGATPVPKPVAEPTPGIPWVGSRPVAVPVPASLRAVSSALDALSLVEVDLVAPLLAVVLVDPLFDAVSSSLVAPSFAALSLVAVVSSSHLGLAARDEPP